MGMHRIMPPECQIISVGEGWMLLGGVEKAHGCIGQ